MTTIFDDLKADHDRHRNLLDRIARGDGDKSALFEAFRVEVSAHAASEEQTLYASMMADPELQDEARHSVAEHKEIDDYLTELCELDPATGEWTAKFDTMKHRYLHHIEEEEDEMFVEAEEKLPEAVTNLIGERYEERKSAELEKAAAIDPTEKDHKD